MSGLCEVCGGPINRGIVSYRRNRHCSHRCKSIAVRKIKPDELRAAAAQGMTIVAMAKRFKVQRATVVHWLERDHLHELWWSARYPRAEAAA